jgi:hypothetical protein
LASAASEGLSHAIRPRLLSRSEPAIVTSHCREPPRNHSASEGLRTADPDPATIPNSVGPLSTRDTRGRRHDASIILSERN